MTAILRIARSRAHVLCLESTTRSSSTELNLKTSHKGVLEFFSPVFDWIDKQVSEGRSVLIHCLAGAHRAGTTGTAYVMHAAKVYDHSEAIKACQQCRPIVNPIYGMRLLLQRLGEAQNEAAGKEK